MQHESSLSSNILTKYEIADNIDLSLILNEYEQYYEMKFDKKPKLVRKLKDGEESSYNILQSKKKQVENNMKKSYIKDISKENDISIQRYGGSGIANNNSSSLSNNGKNNNSNNQKLPQVSGATPPSSAASSIIDEENGLGITGGKMIMNNPNDKNKKSDIKEVDKMEDRILKPPPQFGGDMEMKQLAAAVSREIYQDSPNIKFDDIISLDDAKRLLSEAVQLPLKFPSLFTGILRPWKGILLHGPPGTGKTLLAKAVATECKTTFFNISASVLVSKWRGDSEKLVRCLFELARYYAPSTIFLDEIDSILASRSGGDSTEHEASRRMKTELLIQMDGVRGHKPNEQVFVMAASNIPWDLDVAVLRRLEKRVMVPLPVVAAREVMIRKHLSDRAHSDLNFTDIALKTEGYSGADIELLCREAAMMPVRRLMQKLAIIELNNNNGFIPDPPTKNGILSSRINQHNTVIVKEAITQINAVHDVDTLLKEDTVTAQDINIALQKTRPSSDGNMTKYETWQKDFGSA